MDSDILQKKSTWTTTAARSDPAAPVRPPSPGIWLVPVVSVVLLFILVAILARLAMNLVAAPPVPQPCQPAAIWLGTIVRQEQIGQWPVAATNAETALSQTGLCPGDRRLLAAKAVADGLEALYATAYDPRDVAAQQMEVEQYRDLAARAAQQHVAFPSALQVAQRAYTIGQFLLTKVALEDAYRVGEVTGADQTFMHLYDSALYNLGYWWTTLPHGPSWDAGVRLLVTSYRLDVCLRLGSGQAYAALQRLFGSDAAWPQPADSPLLAACPGSDTPSQRILQRGHGHLNRPTRPSHESNNTPKEVIHG